MGRVWEVGWAGMEVMRVNGGKGWLIFGFNTGKEVGQRGLTK